MSSLTLENDILILRTPYDAELVEDLKASIPLYGRAWNRDKRVWEIAYIHGQDVIEVVKRQLGETLTIPQQKTSNQPKTEIKLLKVKYIGAAKMREDGSNIAMAWVNNQWSVVFSLEVLRAWFEGNDTPLNPNEASSLYAVLGVNKKSTDKEIKKAYRIAARTWHPDINDDPGAASQFIRVQEAYETLQDDQQRRKYNAGLWLQTQVNKQPVIKNNFVAMNFQSVWRPPKRCGWITVEGQETLSRFVVFNILQWNEIVEAGMIMVSYWPPDGDKFAIDWI